VLAMAPAGIAEMVLTGKVLGLDSTMIAGFQLSADLVPHRPRAFSENRLETFRND